MLRGVDIAGSYQAGFSMASAAGDGVAFCAVKISEGTTNSTSWDATNWSWAQRWIAEARAVGIIPGGYHFLRAGDGAAQARLFHDRIQRVGGPGGMLIQLDCESDGYATPMKAWVTEWNRLTGGHPVLIYSGAWWWPRTGGFNGSSLTPYLWQSHYLWDTSIDKAEGGTFDQLQAAVPASWWQPGYGGWPRATILQFTSRGTCGGITTNVDLNLFDGTRDDLLRLAGAEGDDMGVMEYNAAWLAQRVIDLTDPAVIPADPAIGAPGGQVPSRLAQEITAIRAAVDALSTGGIDLDALAAKVAGRLALPTAAEVADELAKRLGNG